MRAIDAHQGTFVVHCALKLSPYVFLRPVELRTLEWNEVNFAQRIITIAPHKMKMRETHIIPLSEQSTKILKEIQELTADGKFVFPGARSSARPMSDAAINAALRKLGYDTKSEHCAHGFRGMASTLLHEQGYNTDVIERQLAHKEGNAIKAAYNHARHLPERIKMMQDWANYLDSLRDNLPTY
jgi:integrase